MAIGLKKRALTATALISTLSLCAMVPEVFNGLVARKSPTAA